MWSFNGDGSLVSAPLVVNGQVVIGSLSGNMYLVDGLTGSANWSTDVGAPFVNADEDDANHPVSGLGAGGNMLVVPTTHLLVAFSSKPH